METAGSEATHYLYGLDLFAQEQDSVWTYLGYDALSVRSHINMEGDIESTYRYGPFGEVSGEGPAGYGFTGEQWHDEVGLLYLRARYYAPEVGRFVSKDPWAGMPPSPKTLHRYAYVGNNPLKYNDPSGHIYQGGTTVDDPYLQSVPKRPPHTHYLCTGAYGCFDVAHFRTGNPTQIIADVKARIAEGGGLVLVEQAIGGGWSTFYVDYMVSDEATPEQATEIALGIYEDFSVRFEQWEGTFPGPQGLVASSFAIEDLPSHYVGFYATTIETSPDSVLWNYLGGAEKVDIAPPRTLDPASP